MRNKDDEIELLAMSLKNARTELDREKLINLSVKPKKVNIRVFLIQIHLNLT